MGIELNGHFGQMMSYPENLETGLGLVKGDVPASEKLCIYVYGQSASAVDVMASYTFLHSESRIHIFNGRELPEWVGPDYDILFVSYLRNASEMEDALKEAGKKGCRMHCITSDRSLIDEISKKGGCAVALPEGLCPRGATGYETGAIGAFIQNMGFCPLADALRESLPFIKRYRDGLLESDEVSRIAARIRGRIPEIDAAIDLRAAHKRFMTALTDEVGCLAFSGDLPEFDHNEIVGWLDEGTDTDGFVVVVLKGEPESPLLGVIVDSMSDHMADGGVDVLNITLEGDVLERNICGIMLGDAVAESLKEGA